MINRGIDTFFLVYSVPHELQTVDEKRMGQTVFIEQRFLDYDRAVEGSTPFIVRFCQDVQKLHNEFCGGYCDSPERVYYEANDSLKDKHYRNIFPWCAGKKMLEYEESLPPNLFSKIGEPTPFGTYIYREHATLWVTIVKVHFE